VTARPEHWPRGAVHAVCCVYSTSLCSAAAAAAGWMFINESPLKWMERGVLIRRVRAADADASRLQRATALSSLGCQLLP
jgi:hypothetical protein